MKTSSTARQGIGRGIRFGFVVLVCGQLLTVAAQDRSERQRRFDADRQACLTGKSSQNFESCMKEAKAVFEERPGANPPVSAEQLQRNAQLRCEALTGEDRTACLARMRGEGTVSGSVSGGGVLRELTTIEMVSTKPQKPTSASDGK